MGKLPVIMHWGSPGVRVGRDRRPEVGHGSTTHLHQRLEHASLLALVWHAA
jgi:hypothetical protein